MNVCEYRKPTDSLWLLIARDMPPLGLGAEVRSTTISPVGMTAASTTPTLLKGGVCCAALEIVGRQLDFEGGLGPA